MARGYIVMDKPAGLTSFQALAAAKKALGTTKVGHAGTLDRFASGVLIALVGPYTRLNAWFCSSRKSYDAVFRFGAETDTLDPEGRVVAECRPPTREAIEAALPTFMGHILQRPPEYSAVHIEGERAYKRALRGEAPEMPERPIEITRFELLSYEGGEGRFLIECSKGSYVRSLARDLAKTAGSRAYVSALRRLSSGPFDIAGAILPEALDQSSPALMGEATARGVGLMALRLAVGGENRFLMGGALSDESFSDPGEAASSEGSEAAAFSSTGELLGVARRKEGRWSYMAVIGEAG